jgi:hypothetical protein
MVFVIQNTQACEQAATQRKLGLKTLSQTWQRLNPTA